MTIIEQNKTKDDFSPKTWPWQIEFKRLKAVEQLGQMCGLILSYGYCIPQSLACWVILFRAKGPTQYLGFYEYQVLEHGSAGMAKLKKVIFILISVLRIVMEF